MQPQDPKKPGQDAESSSPSPGWFRRHFNEDYLTIYSGRDELQAEAEVAAITRELGISAQDRVLDLCCGFGRHLSGFSRRGIQAIGVDLSLRLLKRVRPAGHDSTRRVVCADMLELPFLDGGAPASGAGPGSRWEQGSGGRRGFTVVVSFFTSFGYFESDAENLRALEEIERVLEPGGRFALDLLNARTAVRNLEPRSERVAGSFRLVEERRFDAARRRIEKEMMLSSLKDCENSRLELDQARQGAGPRAPEEKRYFESVRLFELDEITGFLKRAGLRVDRALGDFSGRPYGKGTARMIVLGRKPCQEEGT